MVVYEWSTRLMGGSIRAFSFARHLPEHGWDVLVITATPPQEWPPPWPGVRVVHIRSREREFGGGISVESDSRLDANPRWLRALGAVKGLLPLERQLVWYGPFLAGAAPVCREAGVAAVLTVVAPNVLMPLGHRLASRLKVPHFIDLRDDFADRHRVESISRSYQRLLNAYGHRYLRRARGVSVVSPVTAGRLRDRGIAARLVMNGYVEDHFADVPWEARPVPAEGPLRVVHLGWLGDFRSIESVTEAIAQMTDEEASQIEIEQVGLVDPRQAELLAECRATTRVAPQVPHREAVRIMQRADVLLAIPGDSVPAALTGKLFE